MKKVGEKGRDREMKKGRDRFKRPRQVTHSQREDVG